MKKLLAFVALILAFAIVAVAQTKTHAVTLSWTASADSTSANPGAVSVYRAAGSCPATGVPSSVTTLTTSAPAGGPYQDTTVTAGTYCYYVEAVIGGVSSAPSNTTGPSVPTFPPAGLTALVQ